MDVTNPLPVTITAHGDRRSIGTVTVETRSKKECTARAAKWWAACWALCAATAVVPLLHFFSVPGFFIAGPVGAYILWGKKSVILGGEGSCPSCGAKLPIARSADKWPLTDLCTACRTDVVIEKA